MYVYNAYVIINMYIMIIYIMMLPPLLVIQHDFTCVGVRAVGTHYYWRILVIITFLMDALICLVYNVCMLHHSFDQ